MKKSLVSKLGIGLLAGALSFLPNKGVSHNDKISIWNEIGPTKKYDLVCGHYPGSSDLEDGLDVDYTDALVSGWQPAIASDNYNLLSFDVRPDDSESKFDSLLFVETDEGPVSGLNKWSFEVSNDVPFDGLNEFKHYFVNIKLFKDYIDSDNDFLYKVNLRDIITDFGGSVDGTNISGAVDSLPYGSITLGNEYNDLHFSQPTNGIILVTNALSGASITNGQHFTYDSMTDAGVDISANPGYHLDSLQVIRTDINTGDKSTNTVTFPTDYENYVSNISTNLENLVGDNIISVRTILDQTETTNGIPYIWLEQFGITNHENSVELENPDGDIYNNIEEYIADTNPTNSQSMFFVGIDPEGVVLNNTSTARVYGVIHRSSLTSGDWTIYTNGIAGNGSNTVVDLKEDGAHGFYQGSVGLN